MFDLGSPVCRKMLISSHDDHQGGVRTGHGVSHSFHFESHWSVWSDSSNLSLSFDSSRLVHSLSSHSRGCEEGARISISDASSTHCFGAPCQRSEFHDYVCFCLSFLYYRVIFPDDYIDHHRSFSLPWVY